EVRRRARRDPRVGRGGAHPLEVRGVERDPPVALALLLEPPACRLAEREPDVGDDRRRLAPGGGGALADSSADCRANAGVSQLKSTASPTSPAVRHIRGPSAATTMRQPRSPRRASAPL